MKRSVILFIHQVGCRGGAGTTLANIVRSLDKKKFEPVVVCPSGDGVAQLVEAGAEVRIAPRPIYQLLHYSGYAPPLLHPAFMRHAYGLWREQAHWEAFIRAMAPDVVCLNAMTIAPMARAARRAGAKVLCLVQETAVRGLVGVRTAWLSHILSRWMDAVVFISQYDRERLACNAPIVEVIPNWIDTSPAPDSLSRAAARDQFRIPKNAQVVLMMGGIDEVKGTLDLLEAVVRLTQLDRLIVVIAGYSAASSLTSNGLRGVRERIRRRLGLTYRQRVLRFVKEQHLEERVRFVGMQESTANLYALSDVLVFPATRPHQSRPALEAGAMRLPVVIPDYPQTREFIRDGYNGLTYKPRDPRSLACVLRRLLTDDDLSRRLGEQNYSNTHALHGEQNARRFAEILDRLVAQ